MAFHRRPHPYAAWPQHALRPWEEATPKRPPGGPSKCAATPRCCPSGRAKNGPRFLTRRRGSTVRRVRRPGRRSSKRRQSKSETCAEASTWGEKALKELEAFFPQVKPFRELYSGGKFVQVQFKSAPSFCLGVLPASSALLAAAGNFAVGFLLRCLAVWRPFVARPEAESPFSYEPLQGPVASVVLFFWGLLACVLVRNR